MNPSPILCMTASVDVQISEIQNISELYEVVTTVGVVDEEKACNKHALHVQEIWRKYLVSCLHMLLESMGVQKIVVI